MLNNNLLSCFCSPSAPFFFFFFLHERSRSHLVRFSCWFVSTKVCNPPLNLMFKCPQHLFSISWMCPQHAPPKKLFRFNQNYEQHNNFSIFFGCYMVPYRRKIARQLNERQWSNTKCVFTEQLKVNSMNIIREKDAKHSMKMKRNISTMLKRWRIQNTMFKETFKSHCVWATMKHGTWNMQYSIL